MGALANAAILIRNATFQDWCMASAAYQARQVIIEPETEPNHDARMSLATSVVANPINFRTRFTIYLATDPEVASKGSTPEAIGEAMVLDKVKNIWTMVSLLGITMEDPSVAQPESTM